MAKADERGTNLGLAKNFFETLLKTQFLDSEGMARYQARLLGRLYHHALSEVPYYADRPAMGIEINPLSSQWRRVPFLSRAELAEYRHLLTAKTVPAQHGESISVQSGGTTGKPVNLDLSRLEKYARSILTYRMFKTWNMDPGLDLFMIRKSHSGWAHKDGIAFRKWAYPWIEETQLGDRVHLDIMTPPDEQLDHLSQREPVYVNTLPSNLLRLGMAARRRKEHRRIPVVVSVAEYLAPEVRVLAHDEFGSKVINILSSSESGVIAIECPTSGHLHVQAEAVLVEILNEDGNPVREGEAGELVVTALYNYATPLVRYRTGDYVEKGPACPCGVKLPTISKVLGRKEHMFTFRDGHREIPPIDRVAITSKLESERWRWVQVSEQATEFQHQMHEPMNPDAWKWLSEHLRQATQNNFTVAEEPSVELPVTSGRKRHFTLNQCTF